MFNNLLFDPSVIRFLVVILFLEPIILIKTEDCVDSKLQADKCISKNPFTQMKFIQRTIRSPKDENATPPAKCGMGGGILNRVVGGLEAKRGNYPWMAAIGYKDEFDPNIVRYLCGGSLVSPKYVITAAHCISSDLVLIRLGAHNLSIPDEPGAKSYSIKRTVLNDQFVEKQFVHDLALIELNETVVMSKFINTICLPEDPKFMELDFVGSHPFLAGWGSTSYEERKSDVLREVQVPIMDTQECAEIFKVLYDFQNYTQQLICAGSYLVDSCDGDSGGPLMMPQMIGDSTQYFIIGVVAFGFECANEQFPGVYTRVAAYMPWITKNLI